VTRAVTFGAEASAELSDASRWYEERAAGLGLAFVSAVDATLRSIAAWPQAGAIVDGIPAGRDIRRAPIDRFPYHLAYLVTDDVLVVLAVAHDRRRPAYWTGR
jgi:plasmid stabilization system protein ParE